MSGKGPEAGTSMIQSAPDSEQLRRQLNLLVVKATRQLKGWSMKRGLQDSSEIALILLFAGPLFLLSLLVFLAMTGSNFWRLDGWTLVALSISPALLYIAVRLARIYFFGSIERPFALTLFDRQLDLKDRLATADEFLGVDQRTGFLEAAIEDAGGFVDQALAADMDKVAPLPLQVRPAYWLYAPAGMAILLLAIWLGNWRMDGDLGGLPDGLVTADTPVAMVKRRANTEGGADDEPRSVEQATSDKGTPEKKQSETSRPGDIPGDVAESQGQAQKGQRANSQKSNLSSASSQNPSSQPMTDSLRSENPAKPSSAAMKDRRAERRAESTASEEQKSSSSESGQASSQASNEGSSAESKPGGQNRKGSQNPSGGDEEEKESEDGDRNSSSPSNKRGKKSSSGGQPGSSEESSTGGKGKGRGGRSGLKKSRGVASMILGVPLPDTIVGTSNAGPTKITQEKSEPEKQGAGHEAAQGRTPRDAPVGHVEHPDLHLWMRNVVEEYFINTHKQTTGKEE